MEKTMNIIKKISTVPVIILLFTGISFAQQKAPDASFKAGNKTLQLSHFQGKKRILWLFSTWCPSCAVGLQELSKKQPELLNNDVQVIALRNYNNGGYPGLSGSIDTFIKKFLKNPRLLKAKNWTFGEASKDLEHKYNPNHDPDIYFLINSKDNVVKKGTALGAHLKEIMSFTRTSVSN